VDPVRYNYRGENAKAALPKGKGCQAKLGHACNSKKMTRYKEQSLVNIIVIYKPITK
jgi:hypothetical protein